jgi:hypothetical protein
MYGSPIVLKNKREGTNINDKLGCMKKTNEKLNTGNSLSNNYVIGLGALGRPAIKGRRIAVHHDAAKMRVEWPATGRE